MTKNITIYTSKHCPYSKRVINYMYENGIPFHQIKADQDKTNAEELKKLDSGLRTPVIKLENGDKVEVLLGWNKNNMKKVNDFFSTFTT